jgi:hypothetical protein
MLVRARAVRANRRMQQSSRHLLCEAAGKSIVSSCTTTLVRLAADPHGVIQPRPSRLWRNEDSWFGNEGLAAPQRPRASETPVDGWARNVSDHSGSNSPRASRQLPTRFHGSLAADRALCVLMDSAGSERAGPPP